MTEDSPSEIYFIRHGETDWNHQNLIQGQTDIPLNETGRKQAIELGELLAGVTFSAAFSSDLSRAHQTADLILSQRSLPVIATSSLRERSAGALEGLDKKSFEEKIRPFLNSEKALDHDNYFHTAWHPEMETMQSVFLRVIDFLRPHMKMPQPHQMLKHPLLVVSHGGVIRTILDHLSFLPKRRWVIGNCGFIKVKMHNDQLELLQSHRVSYQSWI